MRRLEILAGFCLALALACAAAGKIIYVDDDANAPGDGKSWVTAYRYLQDALADAKARSIGIYGALMAPRFGPVVPPPGRKKKSHAASPRA